MRFKSMQTLSCSVVLLWFGSLCGAEPKVLVNTHVATNGEFLTVPVVIAGRQYSFVVDTGSTGTVLHSKFLSSLLVPDEPGPAIQVREGKQSKLYIAPPMKVVGTESGALPFPKDTLIRCIDLTDLNEGSDKEIDGVLGMDFLGPYALRLDIAAGSMQILDSDSLAASRNASVIPLEFVNGTPRVLIECIDAKFWAVVDTGALLTLHIHPTFHAHLHEQGELYPWEFEVLVDGRTQVGTTSLGSLKELKVGPFQHRLLSVDKARKNTLLGLNYWMRYHATFDFPRKAVLLQPGRYFNMIDETGHSGIFIKTTVNNPNVKEVGQIVLGCFAEQAGVKIGDRVLSINGETVGNLSVLSIHRRLSQRRFKKCVIKLERDGMITSITLPALDDMPSTETSVDKTKEE